MRNLPWLQYEIWSLRYNIKSSKSTVILFLKIKFVYSDCSSYRWLSTNLGYFGAIVNKLYKIQERSTNQFMFSTILIFYGNGSELS